MVPCSPAGVEGEVLEKDTVDKAEGTWEDGVSSASQTATGPSKAATMYPECKGQSSSALQADQQKDACSLI